MMRLVDLYNVGTRARITVPAPGELMISRLPPWRTMRSRMDRKPM
jgi:hypothetical protein